jgi:hypothetical protein
MAFGLAVAEIVVLREEKMSEATICILKNKRSWKRRLLHGVFLKKKPSEATV